MLNWRRVILCAALLAGCGSDSTRLTINVTVAGGVSVPERLAVSVYDPQRALIRGLAVVQPSLPGTLVIAVPDVGQTVRVVVAGAPQRMLGAVLVRALPYQRVEASLSLSAATSDGDGDGVPDAVDDCPSVADPEQRDDDGRGGGDACQSEDDLGAAVDLAAADSNAGDLGSADLKSSGDLAVADLKPPPDMAAGDLASIGSLVGTAMWGPAAINLTNEGTVDWAQFATSVSTDVNRKASGGSRITLAPLAGTTPGQNGTLGVPCTWSDGTPTLNGSAVASYILAAGAGAGFVVTVPAGTTPRTVRLYLHLYNGTATVTAHLSDNSAPDYTNTAVWMSGGPNNVLYTLTFNAASTSKTLTITFTETIDLGGSMGVSAVTLY